MAFQFDLIEALGFAAGACAAFSSMPQAWKIVREKTARDVSSSMYLMSLAGAALWMSYGALRGSPALMLWNLVWFFTSAVILFLKWRVGPSR